MFDDAIDVMMSSGEPLFRPRPVMQAVEVMMMMHPQIKAKI
jgi:hypothetical protein